MTALDTPAIGRKIDHLYHHDRALFVETLQSVSLPVWKLWARAWLLSLHVTDEETINRTIPGIIFVWTQLIKEHTNAAQRPGSDEPDRTGEGSGAAQIPQQP